MAAKKSARPSTDAATGLPPSPLRELALVADGERGAVLGPKGEVSWLCVPRWHDEPVFASLIGGQGEFVIQPVDPWWVPGGRYESGSMIWCSRWVSDFGVVECDEALAYPGDIGRVVLLRRIRAVVGTARVSLSLAPVTGFAGAAVEMTRRGEVWSGESGDLRVRLLGAANARHDGAGRLSAELEIVEGESHDVVLELARSELPADPPDAQDMWAATRAAWERTVPSFEGLHTRADIRQSYAVLAGLTSADHGMVAAATMSLPERARSGRNYDYRYAWIRDQCYVGRACASLGHVGLLDSALDFVTERILADGPDLKPAYTVSGGSVPGERHVGLRGYPGGGDVVGNWVNQQFQLDSLGEALSMFAAADEVGALNQRHWLAVSTCVEVIGQKWQDPDAGIWELEDDVYTQSRLSCVAGLNAIARRTTAAQGAQWAQLADTILAQTAATSVHSGGYWQQSPTRAGVDASLLRPLGMGALSMDEPRSVATLHAVLHDLTVDGYVYRFRQDERPLADAEGSFTLCGFLVAQAQLRAGSVTQAVHFFERARASCTSSGLFTEEFDTSQHQLRGNLPQAFVHAAFMETAVAVDGHLSAANDPKEEL